MNTRTESLYAISAFPIRDGMGIFPEYSIQIGSLPRRRLRRRMVLIEHGAIGIGSHGHTPAYRNGSQGREIQIDGINRLGAASGCDGTGILIGDRMAPYSFRLKTRG